MFKQMLKLFLYFVILLSLIFSVYSDVPNEFTFKNLEYSLVDENEGEYSYQSSPISTGDEEVVFIYFLEVDSQGEVLESYLASNEERTDYNLEDGDHQTLENIFETSSETSSEEPSEKSADSSSPRQPTSNDPFSNQENEVFEIIDDKANTYQIVQTEEGQFQIVRGSSTSKTYNLDELNEILSEDEITFELENGEDRTIFVSNKRTTNPEEVKLIDGRRGVYSTINGIEYEYDLSEDQQVIYYFTYNLGDDIPTDLRNKINEITGDIDSFFSQSEEVREAILDAENNPGTIPYRIEQLQAGNIEDFSDEEILQYLQEGLSINPTVYREKINELQSEYEALENCNVEDQCQRIEERIENLESLVELVPDEDLFDVLSNLENEELRNQILTQYGNRNCGDGFLGTFCKMFSGVSERQALRLSINSKIDNIRKNCLDSGDENCGSNEELVNEVLVPSLKNIFGENGVPSSCTSDTSDLSTCEEKIRDSAICKEDQASFNCKAALSAVDTTNQQLYVETGVVFDIISAIANPDQDALRAAKLFGVEADYSNVPKLLRESAPSQICLAKIDGYLDSDRETDVAGAPGLTRYGCQNTAEQVIDYESGTVETAGAQNCLQVLGDIRAQRTAITPDFTTAITYSAFIRAPTDSSIKYTVVVSYRQDGTEKVVNLFDDLKNISAGSSANEFDNIRLPINESAGEVDENSFQIGLFSYVPRIDIFNPSEVQWRNYIALTTPVLLIQEGDYFKSINKHEQGEDSSENSSSGLRNTDLDWDDVEDSISFGGGGG